jgi:uridine kinase
MLMLLVMITTTANNVNVISNDYYYSFDKRHIPITEKLTIPYPVPRDGI